MNNRVIFLLVVLSIGFTGCVTEKLPPTSTYTLNLDLGDVHSSANAEQRTNSILMIGRIRSTHAFSGTDILYTDARYGQNSYAYSRWSDSPTSMLLHVFQEALEKSGIYMAVVPYSSQSKSDLLLESTLLDFSHRINDDGTSNGALRMRFNLIDYKTKRVIASRDFVSSVPVTQQNAQGAVAALNKAVVQLTQDLIDWLR
ncbi:MAG: ABC-type transport auxiliary lipoprotein family protein [Pseudomonadota bacterium]|nr:ABC-type transport auxiliary lipoprotein family protein [Pseudomonadota bacterium]